MESTKRNIIVTGGSRGIGRAIVKEFCAAGDRVYFTFNNHEEEARSLAKECDATAFKCSQRDPKAIDTTLSAILNEANTIDVLINNAGITADMFLMLMPFEEWDKVLDTNINGVFRWVRAVSRPMLTAQKGAIVNVASIAGLIGVGGQTNYAASKGALLAFTRALAAEFGPKGIRVNAVVPGFIDTDMTAVMPRQVKRDNKERILLKRFGTPEEVAKVVTFLASDQASYVVGQEIIVDGGLTATVS